MAAPRLPTRLDLSRALVRECEIVYRTGGKAEDIASTANTIATYQNGINQLKYIHMYFAKSVGLWRQIRYTLNVPNDGAVISVGAGPCLCLLGWFYDVAPDPAQAVRPVDVLDWAQARSLPAFQALCQDVFGPRTDYAYLHGRYFPQLRPPQAVGLPELTAFAPCEIPVGATVLVPYVLNHLIGISEPALGRDVGQWLEEVRQRSRRVIIADMRADRAPVMWSKLQGLLGIRQSPFVTHCSGLATFSSVYSTRANWPARRTSQYMTGDTILVGTGEGWHFVRRLRER